MSITTQYTAINVSGATTNEVIPAQGTGIRICIDAIFHKAASAVNVTYKDGSAAISGAIPEAANSGAVLNFSKPLKLNTNSAFGILLGGAVQVSGLVLWHKEID